MTPSCGRCGRAVLDAFLCEGCTSALRVALRATRDLIAELRLSQTRQTAMPEASGTGPGCSHAGDCGCGASLPWDDHASRKATRLRTELNSWVRILLAETYGEPITCPHPSCDHRPRCATRTAIWDALRDAAHDPGRWLADRMSSIRLREWAPSFAEDITRRIEDGWQAVDRPEDRLYAGPCGGTLIGMTAHLEVNTATCERRLWATPEQSAIRCKACGNTVIVADRQAVMLTAAAGLLMPAGQIATALTLMLRRRVSANTIRSWAHRGILTRRDIPPTTSPTYRVGDVLDLIRRGESTEPEKASAAS